jgi:hypothetical protein
LYYLGVYKFGQHVGLLLLISSNVCSGCWHFCSYQVWNCNGD